MMTLNSKPKQFSYSSTSIDSRNSISSKNSKDDTANDHLESIVWNIDQNYNSLNAWYGNLEQQSLERVFKQCQSKQKSFKSNLCNTEKGHYAHIPSSWSSSSLSSTTVSPSTITSPPSSPPSSSSSLFSLSTALKNKEHHHQTHPNNNMTTQNKNKNKSFWFKLTSFFNFSSSCSGEVNLYSRLAVPWRKEYMNSNTDYNTTISTMTPINTNHHHRVIK